MYNGGNLTLGAIARKLKVKNDNKNLRPMITICFDDSFKSDYEIALPILEKYGIRATFYVIGWQNTRPTDKFTAEEEIKEISDHGHEIGCHTITHTRLTELTDEQIINELTTNKKYLEEITGKPVYTHCYPAGRTNEHIDNIVGGIYESARGTWHGTKPTPFDGQYTHGTYRFNLYGRSTLFNLPATSIDARKGGQVIQLIDKFLTLEEPVYFILYMHRIYKDDDIDRPEDRQKESDFKQWVSYLSNLKEQGLIDVVPYIEGVRRLNGARSSYL